MEILIVIIGLGITFYLGTLFKEKEVEELIQKEIELTKEAIRKNLNTNNHLFDKFGLHGLSFNTVNMFDYAREDLVVIPIMDLAWLHYKAEQYEFINEIDEDDAKWFVSQNISKLENLVELMKEEEKKRLNEFHERNIWSKAMKSYKPKQYPYETDVYDR